MHRCFHLLNNMFSFPLLVLKGIYHYWTLMFSRGLNQMEGCIVHTCTRSGQAELELLFSTSDAGTASREPQLSRVLHRQRPMSANAFRARWPVRRRSIGHESLECPFPDFQFCSVALDFHQEKHEQAAELRKWMAATIHRLKNRGKSHWACILIILRLSRAALCRSRRSQAKWLQI